MTISPALFPAVTVTVVRDRKIRTALRTNQIAGFVTVPSWKKIRQVSHEDIKEHGTQICSLWGTLHYSFHNTVLSTQSNTLLSVA